MRTLRWHGVVVAVTVVAMLTAYMVGRSVRHSVAPPGAAWAAGTILATAEKLVEGAAEKGLVKVNGVAVIKCEAESGGLSAYERAMLAANRINLALTAGSTADDFTASNVEGTDCVVVGDKLVAAVDDPEATAAGKTKAEVAQDWATAIQAVVQSPPAPVAAPPLPPGPASAQKLTVGGAEKGKVSMGGAEVLRFEVESGGLSAYERAMLAANRINLVLAAGGTAADFNAQLIETTDCVVGADQLIATVDAADATGGKTPTQVAQQWTAAIQARAPAAGATTGGGTPTTGGGTETGGGATTTTDGTQSIVPMIAVGTSAPLGYAQVQGPADLVAQVQAVAVLSSKFKSFLELEVYVPIAATTATEPLTRVQGVGIYAIAATATGG